MKRNYDFSNAVKNPYAKKIEENDLHQHQRIGPRLF